MYSSDGYQHESIMVHEFGHTVMNCGFSGAHFEKINEEWETARADPKRKHQLDEYWLCNTEEFWAELTQAWFNASIREDVNGGINTREAVKAQLPTMAAFLAEIYGETEWLYTSDCPDPAKWGVT